MASFLVVDDDELILKVARTILQKAGHVVTVVKDGHAALEELNREIFDAIITDANMPGGISGFILVANIRKIEKYSTVPIMFLTGRKDKTDVARAIEAGVDDYVVKPIDPDMFLAKIESLLSKKTDSYGFKMTPIKATAQWTFEFEMTGISEQGLHFISKTNVPLNTKIRINGDLFSQIGLNPPQIRVLKCLQQGEAYHIEANFVGLSEPDQQQIRKWLMANNKVALNKTA